MIKSSTDKPAFTTVSFNTALATAALAASMSANASFDSSAIQSQQ